MLLDFMKPKEEFLARAVDFPDIAETLRKKIISERSKNSACNSVWASECGHDCMRYLTYQQCDWDKAKPTNEDLLLIFDEGNKQEDRVILDLQNAGIKVKDLQIHISIAEANITGKLDLVAIVKNSNGEQKYIPVEVKSMSPHVYDSVNTVEDLLKYSWTRKYYGQVQFYIKNDNWFYEEAYLLVKNKSTGAVKLIKDFDGGNTIKFNEAYWNELVKRAKGVNQAVFINKRLKMTIAELESKLKDDPDNKSIKQDIADLQAQYCYPERIKYDLKTCKGCKYEHICITDLSTAIGNIVENESVLEAIDEYVETKNNQEQFKEAKKAFETAKENLKAVFPLEESIYMTDKYIIQTKVRKSSTGSEYLAFDITDINQPEEKSEKPKKTKKAKKAKKEA